MNTGRPCLRVSELGEIPVPDWQRDLIRHRLAALEDVLREERSVPSEAVRKRIFSDKT